MAAPLTAVWSNLDTVWGGVRDNLDGFFGGLSNPESRFTGTNFGPSFRIAGEWTSSDKPVLTVAAKQALYLRAVTYDIYNGHGWDQTPGRERHVDSEAPTFTDSTSEAPTIGGDAFVNETIEIQVQSPTGRYLYSSGYPLKTFVPVLVVEPGDQPFLGAMKATTPVDPGRSYSMTVLLSKATRTELRAAGTDYPSDVAQFYLGTDGVTTRTRELAQQVVDAAEATNPFDQADALTRFLQGDNFEYRTTAPLPTDPNQDLVDYFLFDPQNRGQWASASSTRRPWWSWPARSGFRRAWRSATPPASACRTRTPRPTRRCPRCGR